jgi:hypothetical protein
MRVKTKQRGQAEADVIEICDVYRHAKNARHSICVALSALNAFEQQFLERHGQATRVSRHPRHHLSDRRYVGSGEDDVTIASTS